ncbi:MAG: homocysteine S-methyltransferase family protein [Lachnospiraceae bacterium]|nr:homocysteine S-methyltransferase family protein [Lachnospiraceae bacterium]
MNFTDCINQNKMILMEGALGERLKREYGLTFDEDVVMAALVYQEEGRRALKNIWNEYVDTARKYKLPFIATTPTRRVNQERVEDSEYSEAIIEDNILLLREVWEASGIEMYVGGMMGSKGDAYTGRGALDEAEAFEFHRWEAERFAKAKADFLFAGIVPTLPEAAGMARAMELTGLPYLISFTIQADGRLIDGTTITDAIQYIDSVTERNPLCYMTNCVHPSIVRKALCQPFNQNDTVRARFLGIQGNTSPLSYAELDGSKDLKCSDPEAFAIEMMRLRDISNIKIFGGCCGTDNRHMECVAKNISH